ncbi:hypothetical protein [Streptomyces odonnellii]|uniref:hypothetical protein n=1 Tax=Streptomyces odonnellii TaxID=1417980 RepID=UPI00099DA50D|nr:hypothetical protein [Streptomyces odonnellii]
MQDRRRRTALHLPPPAGPVLLPRERQSSSTGPSGTPGPSGSPGASGSADSEQDRAPAGGPAGGSGSGTGAGTGTASGTGAGAGTDSGSGTTGSGGSSGSAGSSDDNPFAPPPEGRPDQPWRPRRPEGGPGDGGSGSDRSGWGSQWSSRQPGRSPDGFGSRPGGRDGQNGRDGGQDGPESGRGGGLRWDPTDPIQRRARYALLGGMWAFFFALFDFPEIALLLGSLALYWGASSLRNKPADASSRDGRDGRQNPALAGAASRNNTAGTPTTTAGSAAQPAPAPGHTAGAPFPSASSASSRQQTTAAVSGLVTAGIALAIVAATFTVQLVYRDYYTCLNDALTKTGQLSCNDELPRSLVPVFGVKE